MGYSLLTLLLKMPCLLLLEHGEHTGAYRGTLSPPHDKQTWEQFLGEEASFLFSQECQQKASPVRGGVKERWGLSGVSDFLWVLFCFQNCPQFSVQGNSRYEDRRP